jgi:L-methionine (R)-S-oxide reductase
MQMLLAQAKRLLASDTDPVANAANLSALIFQYLENINWVGFYFLRGQELILGPFQGKPACVRIPLGKGVCGAAAAQQKTLIVDDVHQFSGHITCDAASNAEIVIPLLNNKQLFGVLDIDSPQLARFQAPEQAALEELAKIYMISIN